MVRGWAQRVLLSDSSSHGNDRPSSYNNNRWCALTASHESLTFSSTYDLPAGRTTVQRTGRLEAMAPRPRANNREQKTATAGQLSSSIEAGWRPGKNNKKKGITKFNKRAIKSCGAYSTYLPPSTHPPLLFFSFFLSNDTRRQQQDNSATTP